MLGLWYRVHSWKPIGPVSVVEPLLPVFAQETCFACMQGSLGVGLECMGEVCNVIYCSRAFSAAHLAGDASAGVEGIQHGPHGGGAGAGGAHAALVAAARAVHALRAVLHRPLAPLRRSKPRG